MIVRVCRVIFQSMGCKCLISVAQIIMGFGIYPNFSLKNYGCFSWEDPLTCRSKMNPNPHAQLFFIRPSLDGTYYGMALSVCPSVRLLARKNIDGPVRLFVKFAVQMCLGVPSINLWLIRSYLIWYAQFGLISDFSIFSIHSVILKLEPSNFVQFENLSCC